VLLCISGCARHQKHTEEIYRDAWTNLQRGNLNEALDESDRELRDFPQPNNEWHWRFTIVKAEVLLRRRLNSESLQLLDSQLPPSLATSDVAVWQKLTQGSARCYLSEFSQSALLLDQANDLATRYHPELLGEVALRKGTLAFWREDAAGVTVDYLAALQIARARKDTFLEAAALGSLGVAASQQEHYDESIQWNREALALSRSIGAGASATKTLGNMAWSYFELGDYDNSLDLYRQAKASAASANNVGEELTWSVNIGTVDSYLHDYAAAEKETRSALDFAHRLNANQEIAQSLNSLAGIALARGQTDNAEEFNKEALELFRAGNDRNGELLSMSVQAAIESSRGNREKAQRLLKQVIDDPAATASLRWEAEARLATVYEQAGSLPAAEKEYRKAIGTVEVARSSIQDEELRVSFLTNAIEFYDDYVEFLISQRRSEEALQIVALTRARTLVEGRGLDSVSSPLPNSASNSVARPAHGVAANWTQAARRENATILCYWLGSQHSYLWAITPSGAPRLFQLPPKQQIDPVVQTYGEAVQASRDVIQDSNASGKRLYEMLIAPAQNLIPRNSRVVIVPDGSLHGLNFETLLVPSPAPHYWIEDAVVSYSDSPLLIAAARHGSPAKHGKLLLIGDPVSSSADFPPLPQAAVEMTSIEKYFPPSRSDVLKGNAATPDAYLKSDPGEFAFIHFVAHGTSSSIRPLESAVILTQQGDSSKLYGRDVVKLPLNAELVTISACRGAGSRNYSGEGLVGLSWAFLRAGARGVIAALWDVNDSSTATLMDGLYGQISKGQDPATALRNAKLTLLHSGTIYQKPFYWAPFQFYMGS
jgi:CHAT domain-containing protein